jgi:hypothetical protein
MDGYQIGLLVSLSQNFTSYFVFPNYAINFGSGVLDVGSDFVIIGLILPSGG